MRTMRMKMAVDAKIVRVGVPVEGKQRPCQRI